MKVKYDSEADALYVLLREDAEVARSVIIDEARTVDLDAEGHAVGIEVLGASHGVRLLDLIPKFDLWEFEALFPKLELSKYQPVEFA